MAGEDEKSFVDFLRLDESVHIVQYRSPGPGPEILAELCAPDEPWGGSVWLWNSRISPPPTLHYITQQNYYYLDPIRNEVIEFDRCRTVNGRATRGRVWAEVNYWDNGNPPKIVRKSNDFEKWFNRLARWIKRQAVHYDSGEYFFKDAKALMQR